MVNKEAILEPGTLVHVTHPRNINDEAHVRNHGALWVVVDEPDIKLAFGPDEAGVHITRSLATGHTYAWYYYEIDIGGQYNGETE